MNLRQFVPLALILVLGAYLRFFNLTGFPELLFDEGTFSYRAWIFTQTYSLTGGYERPVYGNPFLGILVLGVVFKIFGASYLVERSLAASLGIGSILLTYFVAEKLYDRRTGLLAAFFLSLSTFAMISSRIFWFDNLLVFLNLLVFITILKSSRYLSQISGILQGLGTLTKLSSLFLLPSSIYLIYRYSKDHWHNMLKFLLIFITILSILPLYALATGEFGDLILWQSWQASRIAKSAAGHQDLLNTALMGVAFDPLTYLIGALGFLYCIYKREWFLPIWILSWSIFVASAPLGGFGSGIRHVIVLIPALCLVSARFISAALHNYKLMMIGGILLIVAAARIMVIFQLSFFYQLEVLITMTLISIGLGMLIVALAPWSLKFEANRTGRQISVRPRHRTLSKALETIFQLAAIVTVINLLIYNQAVIQRNSTETQFRAMEYVIQHVSGKDLVISQPQYHFIFEMNNVSTYLLYIQFMDLNATTELTSELRKADNVFLIVDKSFIFDKKSRKIPVLGQLYQNSLLKDSFQNELLGPFVVRGSYVEIRELNHTMIQVVLTNSTIPTTSSMGR